MLNILSILLFNIEVVNYILYIVNYILYAFHDNVAFI